MFNPTTLKGIHNYIYKSYFKKRSIQFEFFKRNNSLVLVYPENNHLRYWTYKPDYKIFYYTMSGYLIHQLVELLEYDCYPRIDGVGFNCQCGHFCTEKPSINKVEVLNSRYTPIVNSNAFYNTNYRSKLRHKYITEHCESIICPKCQKPHWWLYQHDYIPPCK